MTASPQDPAPESSDFEREFEQEVYELVRDTAPRLFAVVVEYREGPGDQDRDAVVVAWGLDYGDGKAEVTSVESESRWRLASADRAVRYFGRAEGCVSRLVWPGVPDVDGQAREEKVERAA
ncbi:hypothetical protein ACFXKG_34145 [Streptomyces sp. NPDC059255]|uniref:hypothetical protein n=1 Tax=Streptomyces sp. NPDC059255 TaxID=3346793 RepID=UPI003677B78F